MIKKPTLLQLAYALLLGALTFGFVACSESDDVDDPNEQTTPEEETNPDPTPDPEEEEEEEDNTPVPGDPSWSATITAQEYFGHVMKNFFYDLKYSQGAISSASIAEEMFVDDDMNGVRISIFGNDDKPAHPAAGEVIESYYTGTFTSITNARAARGTKEFIVFASKKLNGKTSFPDWVKDDAGEVDPEPYSRLLFDYIEFMDSKGVTIDVLGVDNEIEYNEGNITPQKYYETVNFLKARLAEAGLPIPKFIGPERYGANAAWIKTFFESGYDDTMDIYGNHYYPTQRFTRYNDFVSDMTYIGDREFWATEPHWNAESTTTGADVLGYAESAIGAIWDHTDMGLDAIMWWDYKRTTNTRAYLMRTISAPIKDAQPVRVVDHDGESIRTNGLLHTRAFREGNQITLYIVNTCAEEDVASQPSYTNYEFVLADATCSSYKIAYTQWRDDTEISGADDYTIIYNKNKFFLDIPARSITYVTFKVSDVTE
ncbi:MAG: hypothetical protein R3Y16_01985 [Rikenellaceae bacterium]